MAAGQYPTNQVMLRFLTHCANHPRLLIISCLLAGIGLPDLAAWMQPALPHMVAGLLVITAFRIGLRAALGALSDLRWSIAAVAVLQMAVPLGLIGGLTLFGLLSTPLALAMVLACSAPAITGGTSLAIILRQDPARMMQLLVLGTALFPLTAVPVLGLMPQIGETDQLFHVALRSMLVIFCATMLGFALRRWLVPSATPEQIKPMDGANVLAFSVIVIGLMAPLGPMLRSDPMTALWWTLAAFGLSFGLQVLTLLVLHRSALRVVSGPLALAAGNRNIALFLIALPENVMAPVMIFIGCWQLPMYLTPFLLPRLYRLAPAHV